MDICHYSTLAKVTPWRIVGLGLLTTTLLLTGCSEPSEAADRSPGKSENAITNVAEDSREAINKQWLISMVEGAYLFNPNLNNFKIDVDANGNTVIIDGTVENETEKALAEQIALNVQGVEKVENRIHLEENADREDSQQRDLETTLGDASITARVKTRLLANSQTEGFAINVDTRNAVVELSGRVESSAERDLAYYVAQNTDGVKQVDNRITVATKEQLSSTQ